MAFIATPAFSNLYSSNLLSIASNVANITPNELQPRTIAINTGEKKPVGPFDPSASVPMPHQLDDQFGRSRACSPFTTSVWKRNERERYRVRCVNDGYEKLRQHLPLAENDKRVSKVDTLRLAIRYIRHLDLVLQSTDHLSQCMCFDRFREESEGNIDVALRPSGERIRHTF